MGVAKRDRGEKLMAIMSYLTDEYRSIRLVSCSITIAFQLPAIKLRRRFLLIG